MNSIVRTLDEMPESSRERVAAAIRALHRRELDVVAHHLDRLLNAPALDVTIGPIPHSTTFCRQYDADGKGCRCWCLACEQHNAVERGTLVRESQPPDARRGHR